MIFPLILVENVSPERMALDGVPICPFGTSLGHNTCAIASQWMSFRLPIFVEVIHHPMLSMVVSPTRGKFNAWTCPRWGLPPTLEKRKDHANQSELGRSHCQSNQKKIHKNTHHMVGCMSNYISIIFPFDLHSPLKTLLLHTNVRHIGPGSSRRDDFITSHGAWAIGNRLRMEVF